MSAAFAAPKAGMEKNEVIARILAEMSNGGYTKELGSCTEFDPVMGVTCMTGEAGANNYPLRGGKYSFFEGS